jgi:hypothetical protein
LPVTSTSSPELSPHNPASRLAKRRQQGVLVATTGRVRMKVDASRGPIQVGDLLVTSDVTGVGEILVLLSLQELWMLIDVFERDRRCVKFSFSNFPFPDLPTEVFAQSDIKQY